MSRRKQDNPTQRKRTCTGSSLDEGMDPDPMEADDAPQQDLIQCGDCHMNFALADIVKFIAHKRECFKNDHVQLMVSSGCINDPSEQDHIPEESLLESPIEEASEEPVVRTEKPKILTTLKRRTTIDQSLETKPLAKETQTDHVSNEMNFDPLICLTCKKTFINAADLLHHVQADHGLLIYHQEGQETKDDPSKELQPEEGSENSSQPEVLRMEAETMEPETPPSDNDEKKEIQAAEPSDEPKKRSQEDFELAEAQVSSSHLLDPPAPSSQSLPIVPPGAGHLPIYLRHPLSAERLFPPSDRYYPVPISPLMATEFAIPQDPRIPPEHRPPPDTSTVQSMPQPFENRAQVPFSGASGSSPPTPDASAAQRLRHLAGSSHGDQLPFTPYPGSFRPSFQSKLKSCEFCGKTFKFQSNLIVHRRSHTGEKPYKCNLCDHACSQASKLKRHMKTHNKSPNSNGDGDSSVNGEGQENHQSENKEQDDSKAPNGKNSSSNSSVEDEEEEEEPGSEEEEEEEEEEECQPQEQPSESSQHAHGSPHLHESSPIHSPTSKSSVLSEMMKRSGWSEIQQYNEAYQQAMAEQYVMAPRSHPPSRSSMMSAKRDGSSSPSLGNSHPHPHPRSTPPALLSVSLPSSIQPQKSPTIPSAPSDNERDPPPVSKRFKPEPTSPPLSASRLSPRAPIWTGPMGHLPPPHGFYTGSSLPILRMDGNIHHHMPHNPTQNGGLNSFPPTYRRYFPREAPVPAPVLPPFTNQAPRRGRSLANRRNDQCEFCGKVFKNCSNLTVHRRSHTGEKPYKCELCSYACAQSSKLTRHMKTHGRGAKEVFKCEVCGMPFSVYSTLEKHMKKEHWGAIKGPAPRPEGSNRQPSYKPLSK